jgi:hypothetical protein
MREYTRVFSTCSPRPPSCGCGSCGSPPGAGRNEGKKSDGRGRSGASDAPRPPLAGAQWGQSYNPWTGVVQAWPLQQWRPPKTGVLGPRPGTAPTQALTASSAPTFGNDTNPFVASSPQPRVALLHALHGAPPPANYGCDGDWFMDTGTTSHMASNPGILSSHSSPSSSSHIIVGNGAPLPVHRTGHASLPTPSSPLQLNNVLISPSLMKNLISVRALTRDNSISVEFDPFCFFHQGSANEKGRTLFLPWPANLSRSWMEGEESNEGEPNVGARRRRLTLAPRPWAEARLRGRRRRCVLQSSLIAAGATPRGGRWTASGRR